MKIYLHAGMHKTGTTSLQHALLANPDRLRSLDYQVMVNPPQIMVKNEQAFDSRWLARQAHQAAVSGKKALIISAEAISTFNGQQLRKIYESLRGFDPCVVVAFRHWNSFLPSRWKQNCKRRDAQSFFSYLFNMAKHEETHIEANYAKVMENIQKGGFDNIRALSYDNGQASGNLVAALLLAMDIPVEMAKQIGEQGQAVHRSRSTLYYDACRLFNGAYSLAIGSNPNDLFFSILQHRKVDSFYDFSGFVSRCRSIDPALSNDIEALLVATRKKIVLSAGNERVLKWERSAHNAIAGYLVNGVDGRLFPSPSSVEMGASTIEVGQVPEALRKRMVDYLRGSMDKAVRGDEEGQL